MADSDWFHELIRGGYHRVVLAVLPVTQQLTVARTVATAAFAQGWVRRQFLIEDPRREQWVIRTALAATARDSGHHRGGAEPAPIVPGDSAARRLLGALTHPPAQPVEAVILHEVLGFSIARVAELRGITAEQVRARLGGGWVQLAMDLGGDVRVELGIAGLRDELRRQVALPTSDEMVRAVQAGAAHRGVA
jgi:hypothetical protein